MRRDGRAANLLFLPEEKLFCRVSNAMVQKPDPPVDGIPFLIQFRLPDQSTNRSFPDGQAEDLFLWEAPKYSNWGYVSFTAASIPTPIIRDQGGNLDIRPCHDPLELNYYHTEIAVFRTVADEIRISDPRKIHPLLKTQWRLEMSQRCQIHRLPQTESAGL